MLIYAVHSDALPIYKVDDYAYTILAQKISTVTGVSQVRVSGQQHYAVHVQVNPAALAARGIGLEDVRTALANATRQPGQGQPRERPPVDHARHQRPAVQRRRPTATSSSPIATARRCAPGRRRRDRRHAESPRTGAWFNGKRGRAAADPAPARRQHHRGRRHASRRMMPRLLALDPAVGPGRSGVRPLAVDPRRGATTCSSR